MATPRDFELLSKIPLVAVTSSNVPDRIKLIGLRVIGYQQIGPAIVIVVEHGYAQGLRTAVENSARGRYILKRSRSDKAYWAACHWLPANRASHRDRSRAWLRPGTSNCCRKFRSWPLHPQTFPIG